MVNQGVVQPAAAGDVVLQPAAGLGIEALQPPEGLLSKWHDDGLVDQAHYASEMGEDNHAHFQCWEIGWTEREQSIVPDDLSKQAREATGKKKKDLEQKIRNKREEKYVADVREYAHAALEHPPLHHRHPCPRPIHRRIRVDIAEPLIKEASGGKCGYQTKITIVKEGDEEQTMGYPGKEQGQAHHRAAVLNIAADALRLAVEVPRRRPASALHHPSLSDRMRACASLRKPMPAVATRPMASRTPCRAPRRSAAPSPAKTSS